LRIWFPNRSHQGSERGKVQMARPYAGDCVPTATIDEYLDRLEEVIECAPVMPFTGKCILDRKELQGLLTAMRDALQPASAQSNTKSFTQIRTGNFPAVDMEQRASAINSFNEGEGIFEPQALVKANITPAASSQEVIDAKAEANRILEDAKSEAVKIRTGADEYAENALASVEQNALGAARAARKGLDVLQRRRGTGN
jgi:hypothetical protein